MLSVSGVLPLPEEQRKAGSGCASFGGNERDAGLKPLLRQPWCDENEAGTGAVADQDRTSEGHADHEGQRMAACVEAAAKGTDEGRSAGHADRKPDQAGLHSGGTVSEAPDRHNADVVRRRNAVYLPDPGLL